MQWQNKLPLIAILRGIKPDEAHAHVEAVIAAGFEAVEIRLIPRLANQYSGNGQGVWRSCPDWCRYGVAA